MTHDELHQRLTEQLQTMPLGTSADITDFAIAYGDGHKVVYAFLRDEGCGRVEEEFDFTEHEFEQWADALADWAREPLASASRETTPMCDCSEICAMNCCRQLVADGEQIFAEYESAAQRLLIASGGKPTNSVAGTRMCNL